MITYPYAQKLQGRRDSASGQPPGTHPMPLHMITKGFACPTLRDGTYSELIGDHIYYIYNIYIYNIIYMYI